MRTNNRVLAGALLIGLLAAAAAQADPIGWPAPTLLISATPSQSYGGSPRPVTAGTALGGSYTYNQSYAGSDFVTTNFPQSSGSYVDPAGNVGFSYQLSADAALLDARTYLYSTAMPGYNANISAGAQAYNWYVLQGASGPTTLTADITIQGSLFFDTYNTGGSFTDTLVFLPSPSATQRERVMVFNGGVPMVGDPCSSLTYGVTGTVPVECLGRGSVQTINYIIRSLPFTVDPGVPFFLGLTVNTTVGSTGTPTDATEAWADFFDPRFDAFWVVDSPGQFSTLSSHGLTVTAVPEPASLLLLGTGLVGLGRAWRRRRT